MDVRDRPVGIERRLSDMRVSAGSDVTFECQFSKPDLNVSPMNFSGSFEMRAQYADNALGFI